MSSSEQNTMTVLIAEDDPIILEMMKIMIAMGGHRAIVARDGQEALRLWESERPDVVLMDVQMPEMDGLEATRKIRAREEELGGHVPIYGQTGHAAKEDIDRCLAAGMTGHFSKPIDFRKLKETLGRHSVEGKV